MNLQRHPLSALFGDITDQELSDLAMDIKVRGQDQPGTLYDGMILDGWHRYLACEIAGKKFKCEPLKKGVDPVVFVIGRNVFRRHLTALQRASIVVKCYEWKKPGIEAQRLTQAKAETVSALAESKTNAEMAAIAGTTDRTIRAAKKAEIEGLGDAVRAGTVTQKDILPRKKLVPKSDTKLAARVLELEAEAEVANQKMSAQDEMLADYAELKAQNETMAKILEEAHGKQMTAALAEIKRQREVIRILEERIRGLQGERNMAIKAAKRAKK